jgi:hypothetical protein
MLPLFGLSALPSWNQHLKFHPASRHGGGKSFALYGL